MWVGAAIFLSFWWGAGFGDGLRALEEKQIKVIRRVGSKDDSRR